MSWIDRVRNVVLTIKTGEGSEFTPLFLNAQKTVDMNAAAFEFNEIEGGLVKRGKKGINKYILELHFQGANGLDERDRFDKATSDQRPWTIIHPKYDTFLCQPITFAYNDNSENNTVVTAEVWETIADVYPDNTIDVQDQVLSSVELANQAIEDNFGKIGVPETATITQMNANVDGSSTLFKKNSTSAIDLSAVNDAEAAARQALDTVTTNPILYMRQATKLARTPARFYNTVVNRINTLEAAYQDLKLSIRGLVSLQDKILFESQAAIYQTAKAEASVLLSSEIAEEQGIQNGLRDYKTRREVLSVIESLNNSVLDYINTLGTLQSETGGTPESYAPTSTNITLVKDAVAKATGQLLQIAVGAKQERKYTLPKSEGIITLVHKLLGKIDNETILDFIEANKLGLNDQIQIESGREVVYYV